MSEQDIQKYEKILVEDPQSRAFAPLAEAYRKVGKLDDAIRVAEAGLEIHPGYTGGLIVLGRAHYEKKELDKATEVLKKGVSETPESYLGQKFLGKVLKDKGEVQDALRALEAANLLSPDDDEVVRLLEEIRPKADPPKTMEFSDGEAGGETEGPEIVTYEQKPTTVDGVELDPLPMEVGEEMFSFSDDQVEGESVPAGSSAGEDKTGEEEDGSIEELGPEAAAFIEEAEEFEEAFFSVPGEENDQPDLRVVPGDAVEERPVEPVELMDSQNGSESLFAGLSESTTSPEPVDPFPAPNPAGIPSPPAEPGGADVVTQSQEPSLDHSATGGAISTETLADLYAKQGLTDKAAEIYRQILDERPDDQGVLLKLRILVESAQSEEPRTETAAVPGEPEREKVLQDADDPMATLQGWLENAERMKRS